MTTPDPIEAAVRKAAELCCGPIGLSPHGPGGKRTIRLLLPILRALAAEVAQETFKATVEAAVRLVVQQAEDPYQDLTGRHELLTAATKLRALRYEDVVGGDDDH